MLLSLFAVAAFGQECKTSENEPFINVNPSCNNKGACRFNRCRCCTIDPKTLLPEDINGWVKCPGWRQGEYVDDPQNSGAGGQCAHLNLYASVQFRYYIATGFACSNEAGQTEILNKLREFYLARGYKGKIVDTNTREPKCRNCTPGDPCEFCPTDGGSCVQHESGVEILFGTDFHTFYSPDCEDTDDPVPMTYQDECPLLNYDSGYMAYLTFARAQHYKEGELPENWNAQGADFEFINTELGTGISAASYFYWVSQNKSPNLDPPSICEARGVTNVASDMTLIGIGDNCRAGIRDEWPGGKTCKSPYITCLPEENTPDQSPKSPFYTDTHQYTINECTAECTFDQRCLGYEFVASPGTNTGECNLIDDIPVQITNPVANIGLTLVNTQLSDLSGLGAPAICVAKMNYCNPFFQVDQLDEDLLKCYCPNNRKGFYTKKVKRVVENYRYCGDLEGEAPEVTERIKLAAANRMFHLCENWCLFNVFEPENEHWYWNPWKKCFRQQYAGTGEHRSYCNRVISNPTDPGQMKTIEQYFINTRKDSFCQPGENVNQPGNLNVQTFPPTGAPTDFSGVTTWFLAEAEQTCDERCEAEGTICSDEETAKINESSTDDEVNAAFLEAGVTCASIGKAAPHYAAPLVVNHNNKCLVRHDLTETNKGCQWAAGVGLKRICACVNLPSD